MMTAGNDARKAHKILDDLLKGNMVLDEEREFLRKSLPELPKQKTLEEISVEVGGLCDLASSSEGFLPIGGMGVRPRLEELHAQLKGVEAEAAPALPAGMRLADHEDYGRCVVSPARNNKSEYLIFGLTRLATSRATWEYVDPDTLTFIDAKPSHPEFLETEEDYENAPNGTIVASANASPAMKGGRWWESAPYVDRESKEVAGVPRRVLRWGWA